MLHLLAPFALLLAAAAPSRVQADGIAPDVVVFCEPTLIPVLGELGRIWQKKTGAPVHLFATPTRLLVAQAIRHPRSDIFVGQGEEAAAALEGRQLVRPGSRFPFGQNRLVLASRRDARSRAGEGITAEALRGMEMAVVDLPADPAAKATRDGLQAAALWDAAVPKARGVAGTADGAFLLENGGVTFAVLYATDVAAHPSFGIRWPLPAEGSVAGYWVAQAANSVSPKTASFADFLRAPEAQQALRAGGLEPSP